MSNIEKLYRLIQLLGLKEPHLNIRNHFSSNEIVVEVLASNHNTQFIYIGNDINEGIRLVIEQIQNYARKINRFIEIQN